MSAPLKQPNHWSDTKRADIRPYYQNLSPNKSTIIRINTESIESTDSQKPIFHLNKTKTFIKSLNLENNISINGLKPNSSDSIVVYRLSSKTKEDLFKRSVPSQSSQSSDTNPHKKRYLVSQKSGKVYEIVDKNKINSLPVKRSISEPDTDLICEDEYFKYLNLIGSKRLKTESKSSLNQWPLRSVSNVETTPKYDNYGNIILTEVCPKPKMSQTDITSDIREDKSDVSRRKLAKSQWLTEVKDSTNRLVDRRDTIRDEINRNRDKELKEWQTNSLNTISFFDLSSFMGKRIFVSLFNPLNQLKKYLINAEFERMCGDSDLLKYMSGIHMSSSGVTRISRTRDGNDWNPRNYQHNYCFTRLQRLEKWKQLETGLNWRSRVEKSLCKRLYIRIKRINKCPICSKTIEFEPRHQCYEFEPHFKPMNSAFPSGVCDSSEEVVIIGDDFLSEESEDIITNVETVDNKCTQLETFEPKKVIQTNDTEEDDDIMIVEEVFRNKDSNVIIKPIVKPSISSNYPKRDSSQSSKWCLSSLHLNDSQNSESNSEKEYPKLKLSLNRNLFVVGSHPLIRSQD